MSGFVYFSNDLFIWFVAHIIYLVYQIFLAKLGNLFVSIFILYVANVERSRLSWRTNIGIFDLYFYVCIVDVFVVFVFFLELSRIFKKGFFLFFWLPLFLFLTFISFLKQILKVESAPRKMFLFYFLYFLFRAALLLFQVLFEKFILVWVCKRAFDLEIFIQLGRR